jgi:hypothetical protein
VREGGDRVLDARVVGSLRSGGSYCIDVLLGDQSRSVTRGGSPNNFRWNHHLARAVGRHDRLLTIAADLGRWERPSRLCLAPLDHRDQPRGQTR